MSKYSLDGWGKKLSFSSEIQSTKRKKLNRLQKSYHFIKRNCSMSTECLLNHKYKKIVSKGQHHAFFSRPYPDPLIYSPWYSERSHPSKSTCIFNFFSQTLKSSNEQARPRKKIVYDVLSHADPQLPVQNPSASSFFPPQPIDQNWEISPPFNRRWYEMKIQNTQNSYLCL